MMTTTVALVSVRVLLVTMYDFLKVRVNGGQKRVLIYGMDDCSASLSNAVSNSFLPSYKVAGYLTIGKRYKHYRLSGLFRHGGRSFQPFGEAIENRRDRVS